MWGEGHQGSHTVTPASHQRGSEVRGRLWSPTDAQVSSCTCSRCSNVCTCWSLRAKLGNNKKPRRSRIVPPPFPTLLGGLPPPSARLVWEEQIIDFIDWSFHTHRSLLFEPAAPPPDSSPLIMRESSIRRSMEPPPRPRVPHALRQVGVGGGGGHGRGAHDSSGLSWKPTKTCIY